MIFVARVRENRDACSKRDFKSFVPFRICHRKPEAADFRDSAVVNYPSGLSADSLPLIQV